MLDRPLPAILIGLVSFVFTVPASAQDIIAAPPVDSVQSLVAERLSEELRPSPNVSGVRVLGFGTLPATTREGAPEFAVQVPSTWSGGPACLRVQSADALYEATAQLELPTSLAGKLVPFSYVSEFRDQFWETLTDPLPDDALAALLSEGDCATARPGDATSLPVVGADADGSQPVLLVNTFRAQAGFANFAGSEETFPCEPISAPVRTAYDMRCPLPLREAAEAPVRIAIWPIKDGELGLPIEVLIWTSR
jgi:hypothetical protein